MSPGDKWVVGEVDVVALAAEGDDLAIWPEYPASLASSEVLGDLDRRRANHARRVVSPVGVGKIGDFRGRPHSEDLLAHEDGRVVGQVDVAGDPDEDPVERLDVADEELA